MHPVLAWAEQHLPEFKLLLRKMVECETPSGDSAGIGRFVDLLLESVSGEVSTEQVKSSSFGPHLMVRWGAAQGVPQLMVLAHSDTVWPKGTLSGMPFREAGERLWGPGILDMKGGIALFFFAMRAAQELGLPIPPAVLLQVNADEEVGSPTSRTLTEENARRSEAVLVLEPGTGPSGKVKTERKGVGHFRVAVTGRASHAGVDFEQGASAVLELAKLITQMETWTDLSRGVTVNPGVVAGGTKSNVVAGHAWVDVDFRVQTLADAATLERKFRELTPSNQHCKIHVSGGLNRPPMAKSAGADLLFRNAQNIATELDFVLEESSTGGGSDGNFTAALGIPTLDGLGCVGEGAHALHENILLEHVPARISLLALLLGRIR